MVQAGFGTAFMPYRQVNQLKADQRRLWPLIPLNTYGWLWTGRSISNVPTAIGST